MLQSINYRGTFYVSTSVGKRFPEIMAQLGSKFEIGYLGDNPTSFKGQSASTQEQRMQTMRSEMTAIVPDINSVTGFRAPSEGYDATTERLLPKFGVRYHTADPNRTNGRLPFLTRTEGVAQTDALVVLTRTQRNDLDLFDEKLGVDQTAKALIDDFDQALDSGALGLLSVHSQNLKADSALVAALPVYFDHLMQRSSPLWLASAGQVAEWWRDRDRFKLSSNRSSTRIEFNITITGNRPVKGASLIVMLPQKGIRSLVEGAKIGMVKPTVTRIDDYRSAIVFDLLEPGSYSYQATFSQN
jgi:peptidoglycan/xylan/chitin deacetylase (PgdA/CDA1 family)